MQLNNRLCNGGHRKDKVPTATTIVQLNATKLQINATKLNNATKIVTL